MTQIKDDLGFTYFSVTFFMFLLFSNTLETSFYLFPIMTQFCKTVCAMILNFLFSVYIQECDSEHLQRAKHYSLLSNQILKVGNTDLAFFMIPLYTLYEKNA